MQEIMPYINKLPVFKTDDTQVEQPWTLSEEKTENLHFNTVTNETYSAEAPGWTALKLIGYSFFLQHYAGLIGAANLIAGAYKTSQKKPGNENFVLAAKNLGLFAFLYLDPYYLGSAAILGLCSASLYNPKLVRTYLNVFENLGAKVKPLELRDFKKLNLISSVKALSDGQLPLNKWLGLTQSFARVEKKEEMKKQD